MTAVTETALQRMRSEQIVAVIRAASADAAVRTSRALAAGGVRGIEITFSTPDAPAAIRALADDPELFVGAGTVLNRDEARRALEAGARFLVSPALVPPVLEAGREAGVLVVPGALTPTELLAAADQAEVVKLFPASLGGPAYLRALLTPLPHLRVVPTGGVVADNLGTWLDAGAFALGAGGDLCPSKLIAAGDFEGVTARARRYREALDQHAKEAT
jgi:2-dehydro-3-deoxyphosphogluconate aldolase / (4S)-4-hydroxy-2-oxoglutarate aldolase